MTKGKNLLSRGMTATHHKEKGALSVRKTPIQFTYATHKTKGTRRATRR